MSWSRLSPRWTSGARDPKRRNQPKPARDLPPRDRSLHILPFGGTNAHGLNSEAGTGKRSMANRLTHTTQFDISVRPLCSWSKRQCSASRNRQRPIAKIRLTDPRSLAVQPNSDPLAESYRFLLESLIEPSSPHAIQCSEVRLGQESSSQCPCTWVPPSHWRNCDSPAPSSTPF